jgi:hypothetical protein
MRKAMKTKEGSLENGGPSFLYKQQVKFGLKKKRAPDMQMLSPRRART